MKFIVLVAAVALVSCGSGVGSVAETAGQGRATSTTTAGSPADETSVDGPVLRYPSPPSSSDGMAAEVRGTLQLDGDCLYIALDEAGERYPVLWPAGTRWDEQHKSVIPPAGAPMPIGSDVYGGGGYLYAADVERLAGPNAAAAASRCVDNQYGEIAVVNNQLDAIALAQG